jgi:tetratricopeptide (TPR) repeat protein
LRLAALPVPESLAGQDLFESKEGGPGVYGETEYPRIHLGWSALRSLVDGRYQLIEGPKLELYDLAHDRREESPLREKGSMLEAMRQALAAFGSAPAEAPTLDPRAAEQMRALGYLSGGAASGSKPPSARPDPRDQIGRYEAIKAAFRLTREGHDTEAVTAFRALLAETPDLFDVQWEMGASLARLGDHAEAAEAYMTAMRLSPPLAPTVALSLAASLLELGRLDAAERHARMGQEADPGRAHALLARVFMARRDFAGAEREAMEARHERGGDREGLLVLTELHTRQDRPGEALALLDGLRAGVPAPVAGLAARRGDALARLGRNAEAAAAFREEVAAFPANRQAYANLAIVLALERRPQEEVRATLEAMYRASPGRPAALLAAQALEFIGDAAAATDWRRRARLPSRPDS